MTVEPVVNFLPIKLSVAANAVEEGCLCLVDHALVSVLVQIMDAEPRAADPPWYLQVGFGPCEGEGVLFRSLADANRWIINKMSNLALD